MPRARRIFLSIANELSPVILISGGPPGIVTYWIIAIVEFDRRNILSGVRSRARARAASFLLRRKESVANQKNPMQKVSFFLFFIGNASGARKFCSSPVSDLLFAVADMRYVDARSSSSQPQEKEDLFSSHSRGTLSAPN